MERQKENQKPQSVVTAVNLLWASLAVGLVQMLMNFYILNALGPAGIGAGFDNLGSVFTFPLIAFLIFKISSGRNWARITFLVMFVIGMLPALSFIPDEFTRSPIVGALSVAQAGLEVYALFLLFTQPGSIWFRKATVA